MRGYLEQRAEYMSAAKYKATLKAKCNAFNRPDKNDAKAKKVDDALKEVTSVNPVKQDPHFDHDEIIKTI